MNAVKLKIDPNAKPLKPAKSTKNAGSYSPIDAMEKGGYTPSKCIGSTLQGMVTSTVCECSVYIQSENRLNLEGKVR